MKSHPFVETQSMWRRANASIALAAALVFAFEPTLLQAQVRVVDPDQPVKAQPAPAPKPVKKVSRTSPTDNVSDDLNRREAERAAKMVEDLKEASAKPAPSPAAPAKPVPEPVAATAPVSAAKAAPAPAATDSSEPPTQASIPPRPPIVTASLTPDAVPSSAPSGPVGAPAQTPKMAQATPPAPTPAPAPAPTPTPIRPAPPAAGQPATPPVVSGAPTRSFAQSQLVPTQQPTLSLEINKGTAIKLPGNAATVFVAAPDIADVQVKSPSMIYVFAKKPGDTVLYAVDDQDRVLLNTLVSVTSPFSRMKAQLDSLHPGNGVIFDNQGESIILTGTVRAAVIADDARRLALQYVGNQQSKVINNIRVDAPNQVQLRVKIAEVSRDSLKRIGVNWQNISSIALFGLGPVRAGFATSTIQAVGGAPSAAIAATSSDGSLTALVDLLATQSLATILAEPNLVAMSGETASFLAGGEIPVIAPQASNNSSLITVQYKQVGVSLSFTPTIIGDRINMKVSPEVSEVTTNGQVNVSIGGASVIIPAIATRRASTTIELGSGQSFAMAGLLQHTTTQSVNKVPALGDIPVLGALFKSDAYQRNETELVIIVTPYFVEPVSTPLRTPLSGRVPPTDADRIVYGRTEHPTPPQRVAVGQSSRSTGPTAGFKLE